MKKTLFAAALLLLSPLAFGQSPETWTLTQSTLSYHMSHPVHQVDGVSHAARGKGVCSAGVCNFLVAAPVKSFDSGDTNRDEHMLQVTRGADFPIVSVRFRLPESELNSPTLDCDIDVQFAGNTAQYTHVPFQQSIDGNTHHITGTVPATLTDFKIPAPTFLTVPIKNEIPVKVDLLWQRQ
jgi:hypothetical protein